MTEHDENIHVGRRVRPPSSDFRKWFWCAFQGGRFIGGGWTLTQRGAYRAAGRAVQRVTS